METGREAMDVIHRIRDKVQWRSLTNTVMNLWVPDQVDFLATVVLKKRTASSERFLACQVVDSEVTQVVLQICLTYETQYLW
jgi:hypothetical protein